MCFKGSLKKIQSPLTVLRGPIVHEVHQQILVIYLSNSFLNMFSGRNWYSRANCSLDIKTGESDIHCFYTSNPGFFSFFFLSFFKFQLVMVFYLFMLFMLQTKAPIEESRKQIWLVDSKVVESMISFHGKY
jgi:hypothetical protein